MSESWPWWFTGAMITFTMLAIRFMGHYFGISSTFRTLCAIGGAGRRIPFFNYDWKSHTWNLAFAVGTILGGFIAHQFLTPDQAVHISSATVTDLEAMGIAVDQSTLVPHSIFSFDGLTTLPGFIMIVIGGFFVGFGTRYADGCTSGHAITGLSSLQLPSLIAVVGFFIGGLVATHLLYPLIF